MLGADNEVLVQMDRVTGSSCFPVKDVAVMVVVLVLIDLGDWKSI